MDRCRAESGSNFHAAQQWPKQPGLQWLGPSSLGPRSVRPAQSCTLQPLERYFYFFLFPFRLPSTLADHFFSRLEPG